MPAERASKQQTTNRESTESPSTHETEPTSAPTRRVYTVREVAEILGISRESVFALLRAGHLRSILIGKRGRRVTDIQLDAYLRSLEGRPPDSA